MKFDFRNPLTPLLLSFLIISSLTSQCFAAPFSTAGVRLNKKVKPLREIKRKNVVTQSLDFSCGAAGLSTLLNYYLNEPTTEKEIISSMLNLVPIEKVKERRGFSLLDLKTYAQEHGYKVTGYRMDIGFLRNLDKPVLVPIKFKSYRHFVIVKGVMADRIFIADPAVGNISLKINKFMKIWTNGIGLVVEKVKGEPAEYALKIDKEDLIVSDHKRMRSLIDGSLIRTAIYPSEWK